MILSQDNALTFKVNTENYTACIVKSRNAKGNIFVPTSIYHDSHKYIITSISSNSFENNVQIKSLDFSKNSELRTIESNAFNGSSLESLSIPSTVDELQDGWCKGTSKLTRVIISEDNPRFKYIDSDQKIIVSKTKSDKKDDREEFENIIFASRDINEVTIPSYIKHIKPFSFHECEQLTQINFLRDSNLETIEKCSFSYSSLKNILIPSSVKRIGEESFSWCQKLETIEFSEDSNLISIEKGAFSKSSLKSVSIPSCLQKIGEGSFAWCQFLKTIEFSENSDLLSIGNYAFYGSSVEVISIPSKVEELKEDWCRHTPQLTKILISSNNKRFLCYDEKMIFGKSDKNSEVYDVLLFVYRNATSVKVPSFITKIGPYAFSGCQSLKTIEFEEKSNLISIGKGTFSNTFIEKVSIPKHVRIIGEEAFSRCYKLKTIEFTQDSELQTIEKHAFVDSKIERISIPSFVERLQEGWCKGTSKLTNIFISPENKYFKYLNSENKIIIGRNKNEEEFQNIIFANRDINEVTIPSYIKHIKSFSFYECSKLKKINFLKYSNLETIDKESFAISSLERINIPSNVKIIADSAFTFCQKLREVEFDSNSELQRIGKNAFSYSFLNKIKVPVGVKTVEEGAFSFCKNINKIEFEKDSKLKLIDKKAFAYSSLRAISIPSLVKEIGEGAFFSCSDFYSIEFLGEHVIIDNFCFKDCTNLFIASFPNARRVAYVEGNFSVVSEKFVLFIRTNGLLISTIE